MRPVLGLFVLSPFVGEFLLGNLTLSELWLYPLLMLLYGSGAVLIREVARRYSRSPWATIPLLGCAYALIEEGPVDQLLWNPGYAGVDLVNTHSFVPFLGTNVGLVLTIVALHAVWSICVPIAIIESLVDEGRRNSPWLGRRGLIAVFLLYVLGCAVVWAGNYDDYRFTATPFQLAYCTVAIILLIIAAFRVRAVSGGEVTSSPITVFGVSLFLTSVWWAPQTWTGQPGWFEFVSIVTWLVVVTVGVWLALRLAWTPVLKRVAAAGAAYTYAWVAFFVPAEEATPFALKLAGNIVFALVLVAVLWVARTRQAPVTV